MTNNAYSSPDKPSWPDLTLIGWEETREAIHLWSQIVGKVRLALEPMVNHWWQVPFYVSACGLDDLADARWRPRASRPSSTFSSTSCTADERRQRLATFALAPQSVADFYDSTLDALDGARHRGADPRPARRDAEYAVPFAENTLVVPTTPTPRRRFWLALVQAHRVLSALSWRGSSARRAPCTSSGGRPTSPRRGFPAGRRLCIPGGIPNCADGSTARLQPRGQ